MSNPTNPFPETYEQNRETTIAPRFVFRENVKYFRFSKSIYLLIKANKNNTLAGTYNHYRKNKPLKKESESNVWLFRESFAQEGAGKAIIHST